MRFHRLPLVLGLVLVVLTPISFAQEIPSATLSRNSDPTGSPLWEVGLAGIGGYVTDYPGAAQSRFRGFPVPFFIYRGKVLRAGDGGILRGRFQRV